MELRPRVAITMGDAAGIGPEIIVKALADASVAARAIPLVLGEARVLERAMDATQARLPIRTIAKPAEAEGHAGMIELIDYRNVDVGKHRWGEVNPAFGEAAVHYTRAAVRLACAGEIDAMVSAPLNKEAMHAAGRRYEGQTEILGELTGTKPAMLLLLGTMRLMLFTNHMALRAVCDYVRKDRVLDRLVLAAAALRDLGVARPRLAVAGLNPHAGEEGAFGHEERDEIVPAIAAARARGIDAQGPFPADTVFLRARDGAFDLTLALYHDQGLMAVKLPGLGTVGTLLVGLPPIRTPTRHGTALDNAGKKLADHPNPPEAIPDSARVARDGGGRPPSPHHTARLLAGGGEPLPFVPGTPEERLHHPPVVPPAPSGSPDLAAGVAAAVAAAPADTQVMLLARHGIIAWGASVQQACDVADLAEYTARIAIAHAALPARRRVIDISVPNGRGMHVYPGDPVLEVEPVRRIAGGDVCNLPLLTMR